MSSSPLRIRFFSARASKEGEPQKRCAKDVREARNCDDEFVCVDPLISVAPDTATLTMVSLALADDVLS